ncbi:MAG: formylglycine-generating enzyme family protein, partial [Planctomycetota bacterium]
GLELPTEAQWEYACRAGTTGPYAGTSRLGDMGWYDANSGGTTHPVGKKTPNGFGLYDMHGNVWEWCADSYDERYYARSPRKDPTGPSSGDHRVVRGGSWNNFGRYCRSAGRFRVEPELRHYGYCGFRVAARVR